jgi:hypothetical protein
MKLLDLAPAAPTLTIHALWRRDDELPVVERTLDAIASLTTQRHWW